MSELEKPEAVAAWMEYNARVHLVSTKHGIHSQHFVSVSEPLPEVALARVEPIGDEREVAWVDFMVTAVAKVRHQREELLRSVGMLHPDTYIATAKHADYYEFKTTRELLADEHAELPPYTTDWLRRFLPNDTANPPLPRVKTGDIAALTAKLPPATSEDLIKLVLGKMPNLREYYEEKGVDVAALLGEA